MQCATVFFLKSLSLHKVKRIILCYIGYVRGGDLMKKITILMFMMLSMFMIGMRAIAATAPDTLVVHYYRYDDNYENFNFWLWQYEPSSKGGVQHDFINEQKDEHGVYLSVDLTESAYLGSTKVGIIIKQGGWDGYREIGGDRIIDLMNAEMIDGTVHAYFVEQDIRIGLSQADLDNNIPDYRDKILQVMFNASKNIVLSTTAIGETYEVYENNVLFTSGNLTSRNQVISLTGVDISKTYTVKVMFAGGLTDQKIVSLQNLYDTPDFENLYTYEGDLGVTFTETQTIFRLWAPLSESVVLNLYHQGHSHYNDQGEYSLEPTPFETVNLTKIENGAWEAILDRSYDFNYYTYSVTNNGITNEVTDPYAYSTGANGKRGMIVNFDETNPDGWTYGTRPQTIEEMTDYIVWELHVRDLTTHSSWQGPDTYRGKFMGITVPGTTFTNNDKTVSTGLDHIVELGVNAVQLLPIFDFGYVDEIEVANNPLYTNLFNWGYMPYHFNTLEGSYATNPFDGRVRINEFKQVVMALHERNIRVIMDVVYNHTGESESSNFHKIVPGYYHRLTETGGFSNGSGTGNETASERSMMRKFMVDSVKFWATEYNLSGFRFDLMALHDVETMNAIQSMLAEIDPTMVVYGEPWTGGTSPLSESVRADKENIKDLNLVGAFNDYTRDAVKGSVFNAAERGWVQGNTTEYTKQGLMYGIVGGIEFPGITQITEWHLNPNQTINYVTAHDNNTLYDKMRLTGITNTNVRPMLIQSNAIVLTSQGIPFLHAGVEMARSKPLGSTYDHNSYESPDEVNQLRWDRKITYLDVFEYYKGLIRLRKNYNQFRIPDADDIRDRLTFLTTDQSLKSVAYEIQGLENQPDIVVIHTSNPSSGLTYVTLPAGKNYAIHSDYLGVYQQGIDNVSNAVYVPNNTSMILIEKTGLSQSVEISDEIVYIAPNQAFDPLSNLTINDESASVFISNQHDISTPGRYVISVAVKESYGLVTHHSYILVVGSPKYAINIDRSGIGA